MSEEKYVIVVNTPEEVAYKLMNKMLTGNANPSKQLILETYSQALKVVLGRDVCEALQEQK